MQGVRILLLFTMARAMPLGAQTPAYDEAALACARFRETVRGELESNLSGAARTERIGRDGALAFRSTTADGVLQVEAWYDSLSVYREGPEGRHKPEAAGMVGGRYRGRLAPDGGYEAVARPFIPDGVREVFDLSDMMDDFLPRLPPAPLAPGGEWSRVPGETLWRLADSVTGAGPIERYRWARRAEWTDTLRQAGPVVPVLRREAEEGGLAWKPGLGPLGWRRTIRVEALLQGEAGGRTTVTQEVLVQRVHSSCDDPSP
jgi:hypothetical protein